MRDLKEIGFDRNKGPNIDFDIFRLESMVLRKDLHHDPTKPHLVRFYVMIVVTAGEGEHSIDFQKYKYAKGSILTIRKDQIHHFHKSSATGFILIFTDEFLLSHLDQINSNKISGFFNELLYEQHTMLHDQALDDALQLITKIISEYNEVMDQHSSVIIRSYLQVLISSLYRVRNDSSKSNNDDTYEQSFIKLHWSIENECKKSRNVQYYASLMNVTSRTLNNITYSTVNKSIKQLIDDIVILQMKRELINSKNSIKQVAYQFSFHEPTNLFKYFKRLTGETPQAFRKKYQNAD